MDWAPHTGANVTAGGTSFRVWAPRAARVGVVLLEQAPAAPVTVATQQLQPEAGGYWSGTVAGAGAGARYQLDVDGALYPDPSARSLPDGVHGAAEVVDPAAFPWSDAGWRGVSPDDLVIYELHVGTFTRDGTFDAAIERLPYLRDLGVNAVEVMPVASVAGSRNWGYDGVALYAPTRNYGGPEAFRRFVDAAHAHGLGVLLDVVYNHLGPSGNYLWAVTGGRYFTNRHRTPWGDAVNFDGEDSGPVRAFVRDNALYWAHEFHVDGLRLDAVHAIVDESPVHIVAEIARDLHALPRPRLVIAEDERNERRIVLPPSEGGFGLDAVWADDLHHQVRRQVAGDAEGYYAAYTGSAQDIVHTLRRGWFYEGQRLPNRERRRGTSASGLPPRAFVHCIQNHDQVGNRALGDRLTDVIPMARYRALTALLLLSPYTPLLFMGQEWAATSPFLFFTDHHDELGEQVTRGRREEFAQFSAFADPERREAIPNPQSMLTFEASKLRWDEIEREPHRGMRRLYRALLAVRPRGDAGSFSVDAVGERAVVLCRALPDGDLVSVVNFGDPMRFALPAGEWQDVLCTEDQAFGGDETCELRDGVVAMRSSGAMVVRGRALS